MVDFRITNTCRPLLPFQMPSKSRRMGNSKTAKERAQKSREKIRSDPELREKYLASEREKYRKRLSTGSRKLVCEMTVRERRVARKQWKVHSRNSRSRKKVSAQNSQSTPAEIQGLEEQTRMDTKIMSGRKVRRRNNEKRKKEV